MTVTELVPQFLIEDLARSGLEPQDVRARLAGPGEKQVTNTPMGVDAYVLPYFDMHGKQLPFYRAKLINNPDPKIKYKQIATSPNHVYFPLGFEATLRGAQFIIITEGEKKAKAAVKAGFPCVGLGGTDSWKNRTVVLHKDSQVGQSKSGQIVAKMPAGAEVTERVDTLARGLQEIIDYAIRKRIPIIICFDSDLSIKELIRFEVQRSAATLGYELRHRGVSFNQIKQLVLRPIGDSKKEGKLGLDDFLVDEALGPDELERQIDQVLVARTAFPRHPNPREYVNRKLQNARLARSEMQGLGNAIICDLDARGLRLHCPDDDYMYYFDEDAYKLIKVLFTSHPSFSQTPIGIKLYNDYGLTIMDNKLLSVLNSQFCAEPPVQTVKPEKVLVIRGNTLYYQISDGLMIRVNKDEIKILTNGSDDVLFEGDLIKPIPHQQLLEVIGVYKGHKTLENRWYATLKEARVRESTNDYQRRLLSLLYSISPYMYRWRGTQLPIEQMLGEAGSGKSTLYSLRQQILTGVSVLRNAPNDIRDWTASVAHTGGIHVTDNVHMTNSRLKQELSDELAQPLTSPIVTPTGVKTMGEVKVGDKVLDPWGRHANVVAEHPHGVKPVYKVTFSNGTEVECCMEHKWFVQTRDDMAYGDSKGRVLSLQKIVDAGLRYKGKVKRARWFVPTLFNREIDLTNPDIDYSRNSLSPYNMGLMLGDGNFSSNQLWISGGDKDAIDRFEQELPDRAELGSSKEYSYYLRGDGVHKIKKDVEALGLKGVLARTKFIPDSYLYTTASKRLELLRGLMDSDGTIHVNCALFSTTSKALAEGVQFLAHSLGGRVNMYQRADDAYQVTISFPDNVNPFYCARKTATYKTCCVKEKRGARSIVKVEYVGEKEVKCISLDTREGLYLTNGWTITHNCRIITEPDPHIERRKLYSDNELIRTPVKTVFAVTAIKQPFTNTDIIQRSIIAELDKGTGNVVYDAAWETHQLNRYGGRLHWVAHQMVFMQRLFQLIDQKWKDGYKARFRLINVEQLLSLASEVYGEDGDWIPSFLETSRDDRTAKSDFALEGLIAWADHIRRTTPRQKLPALLFNATDMVWFFEADEDFDKNPILTNSRSLGNYLMDKKNTIAHIAGIVPTHYKKNNRHTYKVIEVDHT